MDLIDHEFVIRGDVRVLRKDFADGQHPRVGNGSSIGPVEVEGDIRRRQAVLDENAIQDAVSWAPVDLIRDFRPRIWAEANESGEPLGFNVHGKG